MTMENALNQDAQIANGSAVGSSDGLGVTSEHQIDDITESFTDFHRMMITGEGLPPRPFWLKIGDAGFKITEQNRDNLALGMLLCLDIRAHLGR